MAKPRKTEDPDKVMDAMNPEMNEETSDGRGNDETKKEESS